MPRPILYGTGWRPDPPDERDLTFGHDRVREMLAGLGVHEAAQKLLPAKVDLRPWCSPVQFQGYYNTCTAHVVAGMIELLETKANGSYVQASRLFLYQVAKRILGESGDPGVYLRQMMGAVVLLGVPPEKYWPYLDTEVKDDPRIDADPDAFCYALARRYGAAKYFRLDSTGLDPQRLVSRMKRVLAASMPTSLGFPLYRSSLTHASTTGEILFPAEGEAPIGSHAVLVVGYDDAKEMPISGGDAAEGGAGGSGTGGRTSRTSTTSTSRGAFLLENSWGETWGDAGYGWLPYRYLEAGLAKDCWTLMQAEWVETDQFQLDLETEGGAGEDHSSAESRRRASSTRSRSRRPPSQ